MSEEPGDSDAEEERNGRSSVSTVEDIGPRVTDEPGPDGEDDGKGKGKPSEGEADRDGPLAGLAEAVDERRKNRGDDDIGLEGFDEQEFTEIDSDQLWAELERSGDEPVAVGDPPDEKPDVDGDVRVIPDSTCHRCRFFDTPPAVACTHEGTEILEMVDDDHFKVVDCPMVVDEDDADDGFQFQPEATDDAE
ncbi:MAG: hypothetical protein ABEH65_02075 [Halobacteriales archaeon]